MHRNGIAHRDIKGANCLVGNDGVVKLADFGASKFYWKRPEVSTLLSKNNNISLFAATDNIVENESNIVDIIDEDNFKIENNIENNSNRIGEDIKGTPCWIAPEIIKME